MQQVFYILLFSFFLPVVSLAQNSAPKSNQASTEHMNRLIKEAYEKGSRITVQAKMYGYERRGSECVQVEKIRLVSGTVISFSPDEAFTIKEYRGFAPFMDKTQDTGLFQMQHTICLSKVLAIKKQNQLFRVIRDTGETAGFIGFSAAAVPTIPVILILASAGKIDW